MKKKILVVIAAAAIIITTFKSGYAYYENQTKGLAEHNLSAQSPVGVAAYVDNKSETVTQDITQEENQEVYTYDFDEDSEADVYNEDSEAYTYDEDSDGYTYNDNGDEAFFGGCCGSGAYSMLDENGNFKTPEIYEKELDEGVETGDLTEEDKEYFMEIFNQCYEFYSDKSQELSQKGL